MRRIRKTAGWRYFFAIFGSACFFLAFFLFLGEVSVSFFQPFIVIRGVQNPATEL
jgi:hypothetical protein